MVFATAVALQPSIVYIDHVEKVFSKASKKAAKNELARLRSAISSHKSLLTRANRVLVIGNSQAPFSDKLDKKEFNKFFHFKNYGKLLFCPCPDYATRMELWRYFIDQTGISTTDMINTLALDLDMLAYISEGFTAGNILQAVKTTLPQRRVDKYKELFRKLMLENREKNRLRQKSFSRLNTSEFVANLSKTLYTYSDVYTDFRDYTMDVTGEAERRRQLKLAEKAEQEDRGKDKKGGKRR
jgi:SpoVK/Ycf46/Vps4 family AAA+-type ATPase